MTDQLRDDGIAQSRNCRTLREIEGYWEQVEEDAYELAIEDAYKQMEKDALNDSSQDIEAIVHCYRCDKSFASSSQIPRDKFCGQMAARLKESSVCPHCEQTDWHWVYAADYMPSFDGNFEQKKASEKKWLREN